MAATFSIPPTVVTFHAVVQGSRHEVGDIQRLTLGVFIDDFAEWTNLLTLVTTKYHVHSPLGGDVVIDIVRGPGSGYLMIDALGEGGAILIDLQRNAYPRGNIDQTLGSAAFLLLTGGTW